VELLEKHFFGTAKHDTLLEGPKLCCGKLMPVVGICQGKKASMWLSSPVKYATPMLNTP